MASSETVKCPRTTLLLSCTLQIAIVSRKVTPEKCEKRACVPKTTALVLLGFSFRDVGGPLPSLHPGGGSYARCTSEIRGLPARC
jgi:hypothetical protein